MQISEQEWISQRAYALWESSGYHHGGDLEHWVQAQSEFKNLGDDPSVDETIIAEVRAKPKAKPRKK
jgi:hypothetical protein